jgi:hypothetical protein
MAIKHIFYVAYATSDSSLPNPSHPCFSNTKRRSVIRGKCENTRKESMYYRYHKTKKWLNRGESSDKSADLHTGWRDFRDGNIKALAFISYRQNWGDAMLVDKSVRCFRLTTDMVGWSLCMMRQPAFLNRELIVLDVGRYRVTTFSCI